MAREATRRNATAEAAANIAVCDTSPSLNEIAVSEIPNGEVALRKSIKRRRHSSSNNGNENSDSSSDSDESSSDSSPSDNNQ